MATAIELKHVSKLYRLGMVGTGTLANDVRRWWTVNVRHKEDPYLQIGEVNDRSVRGESDYVWALRDINFSIEQGDVVGIIGKNGAGKSTLLKILSRVTAPTTGNISIKGRIGSLLEVGTGFHPEMTGRENIYLNGTILGMTRSEINRKFDEIVDFSGCERYIDTPVKRYSSGMMVRLGFAVAAHLDPEILVVDEVLAVGDHEFQEKAIGKMKDVSQGQGRTVLFVSHNMEAIRKLCKNGILLEKGHMFFSGSITETVDLYLSLNDKLIDQSAYTVINPSMRDFNRSLKVQFISIEHEKGNNTYASNENITLIIEVEAYKSVARCRINCTIRTMDDCAICNNSSSSFFNIEKGEKKRLRYTLYNPGLVVGKYTMSFSVGVGNTEEGESNFDVVKNATSLTIDRLRKDEESYFMKWDTHSWGHIIMHNDLEDIS